jgi:hypothetical protein
MKVFRAIAFVLAAIGTSLPQVAVEHETSPSLQFRHIYSQRLSSWFVDYVVYRGERALRIPVHHYHAACNGYLYLTAERIAYNPSFTPKENDGFDYSRSDLKNAKLRFAGVDLYFLSGKRDSFAFISEPESGSDAFRPDERQQLLTLINLGFHDFAAAERQFLGVLAGSQSKFLPQADAGSRTAQAPSVRVLPPPNAEKDAPIDVSGAQAQIYGVAADDAGIREIKVAGQPAVLTKLTPQISLFQASGLALRPGVNDVPIAATFANGSTKEIQARLNRQEIAIDGTENGPLVVISPITAIKGTITGIRGVEDVQVAGVHARILHASSDTVHFDAEGIDVAPGSQELPGVVQAVNGAQQFLVPVNRVKGIPPLSYSRIEDALRNGIFPRAGLRKWIEQRGVNFKLDTESENKLRSLGADDNLILAIYKNRR